MKKNILFQLLAFCCCLFFNSCNTATPEKYFGLAVLNVNSFAGFADDGMARQLESPSAKMGENGEAVAMKRSEELETKIKFMDEEFEKLKDLQETADTKEILQNSLALYKYALPVYKTAYAELAKLYDDGAPKEQLHAKLKALQDKYFSRYNELYDKLISSGKLFAERHAINVKWN